MKVILFGKNSQNIKELIENLGFEIVNENPDAIISYGGDGTLLSAEKEFPGIPKLPIRNSQFCNKCPDHKEEVLLKKLKSGKLKLKEYSKLETEIEGQKLTALNDFVIRNKEPMHSIRFTIQGGQLLIGDGIVVSAPFGSTGYFKSITGQTFDSGFGLAFNNTTEKMNPQFFNEGDQIIFKLVRGNAALTSDNNPDIYLIPESIELTFKLSNQVAKIYSADSLRCPNCQVIRG